MTDAKTREHRDKEWWDAWWSEDFSWDGLGALNPDGEPKHPWEGWVVDTGDGSIHEVEEAPDGRTVRPATLQDYWRDQEGDLITGPDGVRFTRVHLPPAWKDGTPTGKADWPNNALDLILAPKLRGGEETELVDAEIKEPEHTAQLGGCILLKAARHPDESEPNEYGYVYEGIPLAVQFKRAAFLRDADFSFVTFLSDIKYMYDAGFDSANFCGEADFSGAKFPQLHSFSDAIFSCGADFFGANFEYDHVFSNATFSGDVRFFDATFSSDVYFDDAVFSGDVSFEGAKFSGFANFGGVTFSGDANFKGTTFSDGKTVFERATFSGTAVFLSATFSGDVSFNSATFSGAADFHSATFSGGASFHSATFSDDASFFHATFSAGAVFLSATFSGGVSFNSATYLGAVDFRSAEFGGPTFFVGTLFDKLASFERIVWPSAAQNWHGAFTQTLFKAAPVLTGAGFKSLAAFDGAVLERGVTFDDPPSKASDRVFKRERRDAIKAARADLAAWVEELEQERQGEPSEAEAEAEADTKKPKRISGRERKKQLEAFRNRRLAELEGGCRTLKKAMEYASNKTREQLFYRYELIARRAQAATPLSEKIFSYLYDWFGNYGASIGRPFIAVTALTLLFSFVYWGLDIGWLDAASHAFALTPTTNVDPALERALSFSASRIFPFGAFDDVSADWLQSYETAHGSLAALGVRILASLQSTFALTLVFMVGLAVRRKFQIS